LKPVLKSRRGISEAVTAMLLVGVAIAAGAVFVLYFSGVASRVSQTSGSLQVVASGVKVYLNGNLSKVIFNIQVMNNLGSSVKITGAWLQEAQSGSNVTCTLNPSSVTLNSGSAVTLSATCPSSGSSGSSSILDLPSYTLTLTYSYTTGGQPMSVSVKAPASG